MIIFSIIGGILAIITTLVYLRDSLGALFNNKKISRKSLKMLRLIRGILYILIGLTIVAVWGTFINIKTKEVFLCAFLIILDFAIFAVYKNKIKSSIYKMEMKKKKARIKAKQDMQKRQEREKRKYRECRYS